MTGSPALLSIVGEAFSSLGSAIGSVFSSRNRRSSRGTLFVAFSLNSQHDQLILRFICLILFAHNSANTRSVINIGDEKSNICCNIL